MMKVEEIGGEYIYIYIVDGPSLNCSEKDVQYGLRKEDLKAYVSRCQLSQLAQFYGLVNLGLILSRHCFQGLERDLYCDSQSNGDEEKFILVRKPSKDYSWFGGKNGDIVPHLAPIKCVFTVIISCNKKHKAKFPTIEGWIDRWAWTAEDDGSLLEAPQGWVDRYTRKVWSR